MAAPPSDKPTPGAAALERARTIETLEDAYQAWDEVERERDEARARARDERRRLDEQGEFLVGAVRAAGAEAGSGEGLLKAGEGLVGFQRTAEEKLRLAKQGLEDRLREEERAYGAALTSIAAELGARVRRFLAGARPRVTLMLRPAGERRIVHLARVSADDAVLLLALFTGAIPSRYDFLFDDSTDDASLPPTSLYPEAGRPTRPSPDELRALLGERREVLPVKGMLPLSLPGGELFRLLQRGPVLEAELAEGAQFRNLLSRGEAEALAGHLLRLKLEGKLELEVET